MAGMLSTTKEQIGAFHNQQNQKQRSHAKRPSRRVKRARPNRETPGKNAGPYGPARIFQDLYLRGARRRKSAFLRAVKTRKAPNTYIIQLKRITKAAPAPIITPRITRAPRIPQNNTRCCRDTWNSKGFEDQGNHKNIVERQGLFNQITGKKVQSREKPSNLLSRQSTR